MANESQLRPLVPTLIAVFGAALYALMLWMVVPHDVPGYWEAFFRVYAPHDVSGYWEAFFRVPPSQIKGLVFATSLYVGGIGLCIIAFSSLLPIRSMLWRRLLSIPGVLSAAFGAIVVWGVLVSFVDKVR